MKRILTITELLDKYEDILLESTVKSIKTQPSMRMKTKKSLMKQLDHYFESSAYLKGNRSKPPRFELGALRQPVTPYENTSRGRPMKDFTNERNAMMYEILRVSRKNSKIKLKDDYFYYTWTALAKKIYNLSDIEIQSMNFYASPENLNYKANDILFVFRMAGSSAIKGREERFTDRDLQYISNDMSYLVLGKLNRMNIIFHELLNEINHDKKYIAVNIKDYKHEEVDIDEYCRWTEKREEIHKQKIKEGNNNLKALRLANEEMSILSKYITMYTTYAFYTNGDFKISDYEYDKSALIEDIDKRILSSVYREQERYNQRVKNLKPNERTIESSSLRVRLKRSGEYYNYMSKLFHAIRNGEIPKSKSVALKEMESKIKNWREIEKERQREMLKAEEGIITDGAKS